MDSHLCENTKNIVKGYLYVDPCLWKTMSKPGFASCGSEFIQNHNEVWVVYFKVASENSATLKIYALPSERGKIQVELSKQTLSELFQWIMGNNKTTMERMFACAVAKRYNVSFDEAKKSVASVMTDLSDYFYSDILRQTICECSLQSKTQT